MVMVRLFQKSKFQTRIEKGIVMKIDFHTHILPELDDGSRSLEMSNGMLSKLYAQRVDALVLTPHYYSHQKPIDDFLEMQKHAFRRLEASLTAPAPKLILGAEVYFSDYLFNNRDLSSLCIEGTRLMLLELPYNKTIDDRLMDKVDRLIGDYNITPVIAHVERYPSLIRKKHRLDLMLNMGCVLQMNLSSFTVFGKRRLISLVRDGYIGAFGTDAHNLSSRPPSYDDGYRVLCKMVPKRTLEDIQHSMASMLNL